MKLLEGKSEETDLIVVSKRSMAKLNRQASGNQELIAFISLPFLHMCVLAKFTIIGQGSS